MHLKAGDRFYASSEMGLVVGLDTSPEADVAVAWKSRVKGTPFSMIAADGKLFVVTVEGYIYAFGDSFVSQPVVYSLKNIPPSSTKVTDSVDSTLDLSAWVLQFQSNEGNPGSSFCILIGIGDGRLVDQLMDQTDYRVLVLDGNPELIQGLHRRMDDRGLYGNRIALLNGDPSTFQFPPYLAELMLIQDPLLADETLSSSDLVKLFNALRPYGGTALVIGQQNGEGIPEIITTAADKLSLKVETSPQGLLIRRRGALPGAADWTHQHADAANTVVSQDRLVKAPLDVLWFGGPSNETVLPRHGHGPTPQISEGRLLIEGPDMIRSVDVYTGRLLWERKVPGLGKFYNNTSHQPGANEIGSNYVSVVDGIYVVTPNHCLRLDPKTGDILNVFRLPAEEGKPRPKWGHVSVQGDYLIATASPITVSDKEIIAMNHPERNLGPLFTPAGNWKYLAGIHPRKDWIEVGFDDSQWSVGTAGFGIGNNDDQTVLKDMKGNYSVVYIRQEFELEALDEVTELQLAINYDDGFIVYLNGKEVLRVGVESGVGMEPNKITGHKANNYEYFTIALPMSALQSGTNVLAIEGHNSDINNGDFTLDPYLGIPLKGEDLVYNPQGLDLSMLTLNMIPGVDPKADYSAGSGSILVMDRKSGRILWTRNAEYNFRHNAMAVSGNQVFCIDKMTDKKESYLRRRGFPADQKPVLYCLDLQTGEVQWKDSERTFGTWLSYSVENDILLQAGSFSRDRATDEVAKGLTAYRGKDGTVLWGNQESYDGPLLLHHQTIISQGAAYDLLTGKRKTRLHPLTQQPVNWGFTRNYGCNTAVASEYLLTFRSAAAGYYDLTNNGGTANLGGFRAGCTSSLIAAGGVLNAPDYTKTCNCSYQNQASLAFIHAPGSHGVWTFNQLEKVDGRIRRMGLNFGAPGDRMSSDSILWMEYPMKGGPAPVIELIVKPFVDEQVTIVKTFDGDEFRIHPSGMVSGQWDWIASSWVEKIEEVQITLSDSLDEIVSYTVGLVFAELKDAQKGDRVFDVYIQGTLVEEAFDVFHQANGKNREIVKTYSGISAHDKLTVKFVPQEGCQWAPVINGIKVVEEIQFIGGGG
ncbi:MAG TPA: hypothetical protein EYQ50_23930 [Verrucomicrobiales bacterium]|nr:hypothetical protein [Verrucomicrobiales bacterium]